MSKILILCLFGGSVIFGVLCADTNGVYADCRQKCTCDKAAQACHFTTGNLVAVVVDVLWDRYDTQGEDNTGYYSPRGVKCAAKYTYPQIDLDAEEPDCSGEHGVQSEQYGSAAAHEVGCD